MLAPLSLILRAAIISRVKCETEVVTRFEDGEAVTYVVEVLAFVKRLLTELAEEVVVLLDKISNMEVGVEEEVQVCGGAFSSFSTSLCSLEVSDVGVAVAMEEGKEACVVVVTGPETLGKEDTGRERWELLEGTYCWEPVAEGS